MDWTIFQFLAPAIAASLIIAGIHAYLGLHVVERGVIFVDLSLAQIASLGAAIAVWQGYDAHGPAIYWMSLGFTLIGAFIFAMVKGHEAGIPQEAIIGISYAVASAAVILTLSKATGEAEHLQSMLVGNILSVQWPEVWITGAIYAVIGLFHFVFRKRFLEISMDASAASARGVSVRLWDFLFYASFGLVVTRSVAIAGRAAGVLLPDRAVGGRDAVRAPHRPAAGDRLGDGCGRLDAWNVLLRDVRPADRRRHRLHVRARAGADGRGTRVGAAVCLTAAVGYHQGPQAVAGEGGPHGPVAR